MERKGVPMKLRLLATVLLVLAVTGCKVSSSNKVSKAQYSYDFDDNGCKTQLQTSDSVAGICTKLEDHTLNNNCAYGMRAAEFKRYNCVVVLGNRPSATDAAPAASKIESYSYELSESVNGVGCTTGKQTFSSRRELCEGLKNDGLNQNCALSSRQELFENYSCP
jgi:hypothetical protein